MVSCTPSGLDAEKNGNKKAPADAEHGWACGQ